MNPLILFLEKKAEIDKSHSNELLEIFNALDDLKNKFDKDANTLFEEKERENTDFIFDKEELWQDEN